LRINYEARLKAGCRLHHIATYSQRHYLNTGNYMCFYNL